MPTTDPFNLERFVAAQAPVIETVLAELRRGRKQSHWMWFVFPQLRGLGHSSTAQLFGITSLAEARAYLAHPVLGPRLELCTETVNEIVGSSLFVIFGSPDDMKFRSCATLFSIAAEDANSPFRHALNRWCEGRPDEATMALIRPRG
jgi:uncharacterized protein (DUF1810 family)